MLTKAVLWFTFLADLAVAVRFNGQEAVTSSTAEQVDCTNLEPSLRPVEKYDFHHRFELGSIKATFWYF